MMDLRWRFAPHPRLRKQLRPTQPQRLHQRQGLHVVEPAVVGRRRTDVGGSNPLSAIHSPFIHSPFIYSLLADET
jgi:hypothetical protein